MIVAVISPGRERRQQQSQTVVSALSLGSWANWPCWADARLREKIVISKGSMVRNSAQCSRYLLTLPFFPLPFHFKCLKLSRFVSSRWDLEHQPDSGYGFGVYWVVLILWWPLSVMVSG